MPPRPQCTRPRMPSPATTPLRHPSKLLILNVSLNFSYILTNFKILIICVGTITLQATLRRPRTTRLPLLTTTQLFLVTILLRLLQAIILPQLTSLCLVTLLRPTTVRLPIQ